MKTIAVTNYKGGVGKTTSVANLGHALADAGRRVLLVDLDPQASLTLSLGLDPDELPSVYGALAGEDLLADLIHDRPPFHVLTAEHTMTGADIVLSRQEGFAYLLKEALKPVSRRYDVCLIDCQPTMGVLPVNALTAADLVLIPISADYLAARGTRDLLGLIDQARGAYNKRLKIGGVFVTQLDTRTVLGRQVSEAVHGELEGQAFQTAIRKNVTLAEAPARGQTVFEYDRNSHGAADYAALAGELVERWKI